MEINPQLTEKELEFIQNQFDDEYIQQVNTYFSLVETEKAAYYISEIFPIVNEKFSMRMRKQIDSGSFREYDYLILTVGYSPEPLALMINAIKPKEVFFIYTRDSRNTLKELQSLVHLDWGFFQQILIEDESSENIYQEVKRIIHRPEISKNLKRVALDITGGKKSMGANLAIAGYFSEIDTFYVDAGLYLKGLRQPFPGSERAIKLENPLVVFGDVEGQKAMDKFNRFDFIGAANIFAELMGKTRDPRAYTILHDLSLALNAYDNFDFNEAYRGLNKVLSKIKQWNVLTNLKESIELHQQMLEVIKDLQKSPVQKLYDHLLDPHKAWILLGNFYQCAKRREMTGRLDMAALLYYRALELLVQRRLKVIGINPSNVSLKHLQQNSPGSYPEYIQSQLPLNIDAVIIRYNRLANLIYSNYVPIKKSFPNKLGLMNGTIFLASVGDPIFTAGSISHKKIFEEIEMRNRSILAHGLKILTVSDTKGFERLLYKILDEAWKVEQADSPVKLDSYLEQFQFPTLQY